MTSGTNQKSALRYLVRGIMGSIVAATLIRQLFYLKLSNFWIYLGFYFIANGVLSFKEARSNRTARMFSLLGPLLSVVGGLVMVITFPFSAYSATLVPTEAGKMTFGVIVTTVGLLEAMGKVRITPEPIVKRIQLGFGGVEMLLGSILIAFPLSWETRLFELVWISIALLWIIPVTGYMYFIAYRIRTKWTVSVRKSCLKSTQQ